MLEAFGVRPEVEQAYFIVQRQSPITTEGLRMWLRAPDVEDILKELQELGLAEVTRGRWSATTPEDAVAQLEVQLSERAKRARADLLEASEANETGIHGSVELLQGPVEINDFLWERVRQVSDSMRAFDVPPYMNTRDDPEKMNRAGMEEIAPEWDILNHGGTLQTVYAPSGITQLKLREMAVWIEAGERARVAEVHTKLIIFDHREALIGLLRTYGGEPEDVRSIRTDHPIVLEALNSLFDTTWASAVPLTMQDSTVGIPDPERRPGFVRFLMSGYSKEQLAEQYAVSPRTIERDIEKLRQLYDAPDTVQLGMKLQRLRDRMGEDFNSFELDP